MASSHRAGCFQLLEAPGRFQSSSLRDMDRPIATLPFHMDGPRRSPGSRTKKTEFAGVTPIQEPSPVVPALLVHNTTPVVSVALRKARSLGTPDGVFVLKRGF